MKIVWTRTPSGTAAIWGYLEARDPDAAVRMDRLFSDAVAGLTDFPMLGHEGTVADTRKLSPHRSHRIIYEVVADTVWILVLIHTARQWPRFGVLERYRQGNLHDRCRGQSKFKL